MAPRYFGSAPGIPLKGPKGIGSTSNGGFWDPDELHPEEECSYTGPSAGMNKLGEPDVPRFLRGEIDNTYIPDVQAAKKTGIETTLEQVAGPVWDEEDPFYLLGSSEYPHNSAIMTHGQISMEFDSTPGSTRFSLVHWASLSRFEIFEDGKMIIKNKGGDRTDICQDGIRKTYTTMNSMETTDMTKYVRAKMNHYIHANLDINERANGHIWEKADKWIWSETDQYHTTTAGQYIQETAVTYIKSQAGSYIEHIAGSFIRDIANTDISRSAMGGTITDTAITLIHLTAPTIILAGDVLVTGKLHVGFTELQAETTKILSSGKLKGTTLDVANAAIAASPVILHTGAPSTPWWGT